MVDLRGIVCLLLGASTVGCGGSVRMAATDSTLATGRTSVDATSASTIRDRFAKPDVTRMSFDANRRKLSLYVLDDRSARWMLQVPYAPMGIPIDRDHQFPDDMELDYDSIAVYCQAPNRRPSVAIPLREIIERGGTTSAK